MALPLNILQQVITYQESGLAYLINLNCFVSTANTKFKDFENKIANLGSTVNFTLPTRYVSNNTLVASFQSTEQRVQSLTVDQAKNVSYDFSAQQMVFNVKDYMKEFGMSAIMEISAEVESNVALNAETGPYRFYGDGTTLINSYGQLASMLANFRDYGSAPGPAKVYLPSVAIPAIVNSGANQFTPSRTDKAIMSWMIGNWSGADFYQSNLLPLHTAGSVGNAGSVLTVVSTNDPTGVNITEITFSGAAVSDADAIFENDSLQFIDIAGQPQLRYLTFIGHKPSAQPVQMRATADAASNGSTNVTVSIYPALCAQSGNANQNIAYNIVAGMQATVLPNHRCGLIVGGNALYLAMPRLPDQDPYKTSNKIDPTTGVSIRNYFGALFGQNQQGYVNDVIWGSTLVPEYCMKIVLPV